MSNGLERRIERLEQQAGGGKVVVWHEYNGDPRPGVGPDDVLLRIVYDGTDQTSEEEKTDE